jgi:putative tricarboxylic transport membrane protein
VRAVDRWVGAGIAALAIAVLWSSRAFPDVPGQKLGASTLPGIVGACLLACGALLILRSLSARRYRVQPPASAPDPLLADAASEAAAAGRPTEQIRPALWILASIVLYIVAADALGFLLVAPVCVLIAELALRVRPLPAVLWAVLATVVVHVSFYKLLKVPLPWGLLPPLY